MYHETPDEITKVSSGFCDKSIVIESIVVGHSVFKV